MANPNGSEYPSALLQKPPNLSHLRRLTTPLGIVQHARGEEPDLRHGYSIDDSARALIVCIWYADLFDGNEVSSLAQVFLNYIASSQLPSGRFHNFQNKGGKFLDREGSQDSFGRTIWALGLATQSRLVDQTKVLETLRKALPNLGRLKYPRSIAFALLGLVASGELEKARDLGGKLANYFHRHNSSDWQWFERCVRYSNGILPYALLLLDDPQLNHVGLVSLQFLDRASRVDGTPTPIGNKGWYCKGGKRALYDQQCIDAADMVLANLAAYRRTGKETFLRQAQDWMRWFYGRNVKNVAMVTRDGGCYDGINETSINRNQGAESVLAYLLAYLATAAQDRLKKTSFL